MPSPRRVGRPPASSRAVLEEAAGELFLERGFAATSVADVTQRAGVSRSTFFNYFETKSDLLWAAFDEGVRTLRADLASARTIAPARSDGPAVARGAAAEARTALQALAAALPPEHVALAFTQADAMGLAAELRLAAARRTADVGEVLAEHARARGVPALTARVVGTAWAGALVAAVEAWSRAGAGRTALPALLDQALAPVRDALD